MDGFPGAHPIRLRVSRVGTSSTVTPAQDRANPRPTLGTSVGAQKVSRFAACARCRVLGLVGRWVEGDGRSQQGEHMALLCWALVAEPQVSVSAQPKPWAL